MIIFITVYNMPLCNVILHSINNIIYISFDNDFFYDSMKAQGENFKSSVHSEYKSGGFHYEKESI